MCGTGARGRSPLDTPARVKIASRSRYRLRQDRAPLRVDFASRDAYTELASGAPRNSHHLPGEEIPEDYWLYRFLKRQVFFGMGANG